VRPCPRNSFNSSPRTPLFSRGRKRDRSGFGIMSVFRRSIGNYSTTSAGAGPTIGPPRALSRLLNGGKGKGGAAKGEGVTAAGHQPARSFPGKVAGLLMLNTSPLYASMEAMGTQPRNPPGPLKGTVPFSRPCRPMLRIGARWCPRKLGQSPGGQRGRRRRPPRPAGRDGRPPSGGKRPAPCPEPVPAPTCGRARREADFQRIRHTPCAASFGRHTECAGYILRGQSTRGASKWKIAKALTNTCIPPWRWADGNAMRTGTGTATSGPPTVK